MTGSSFTRRGFLGLTSAAAVGVGLSACTGGGTSSTGGGATAAASNNLRIFTYEGDETIGLFKAQLQKFDQQAGTTTTVETHRRNVMRKLGIHSVADLTKYAIREGLTSLET